MTKSPTSQTLEIWALYDSPADMPGMFVLRRFESAPDGSGPTHEFFASKNVEDLRDLMRDKGLHCVGRDDDDEPHIVESWM